MVFYTAWPPFFLCIIINYIIFEKKNPGNLLRKSRIKMVYRSVQSNLQIKIVDLSIPNFLKYSITKFYNVLAMKFSVIKTHVPVWKVANSFIFSLKISEYVLVISG